MGSRAVHAGYALSGFLALGYQVLWFRLFTERFGATSLSFLVVLVGFIGGLGAGALLATRIERWLGCPTVRSRLRGYGVLELLLALSLGLTVLALAAPYGPGGQWLARTFPYVLEHGVYHRPWSLDALVLLAGLGCVALPATLMGATYPLLCHALAGHPRVPSGLYAANTLGAALGVIVTQLALLPRLGQSATLAVLLSANVALGAWFWIRGGDAGRAEAVDRRPRGTPPTPRGPGGAPLLAGAVAAGFLAGAIEGDLAKRLWFLGATTTAALAFISFCAVLAVFAGAAVVRRTRSLRPAYLRAALVGGLACYLGAWRLAYPARAWLEQREAARLDAPPEIARLQAAVAVATDPGYALLLAAVFALPALTAVATVLPLACNEARARGYPLGPVYGANTLAFCAGVFAFTWAAPRVSAFYALDLLPWLFAAGVAYLAAWHPRRPFSRPLAGAALAAAALAVVAVPGGFDRGLLDPGRSASHLPVRALKSNGLHTTYVVEDPDGDRLYFDSHPMSGTSLAAQTYMRLLAHVPLLLQEAPRSVLVIGFGVGNTAAGAAVHPGVRRIDVVELNDRVIETAPEFARTNAAVHRDARVRFFHDDGRRFLAVSDARYDLITSEPPPPVQEGVHRLYSKEYYAAAAARLSPHGMVSQWLPVAQVPARATARMLATFAAAFPHVLVLVGEGRDLLLIGSRERFDGPGLVRRLAAPGPVRRDLERLGIPDPEHLLARVVSTDDDARAPYAGERLVSDERSDLAFLSFEARNAGIAYRPVAALRDLGLGGRAPAQRRLLAAVRAPGMVQYRVPGFPFDALDLGATAHPGAWARSARLRWSYVRAQRGGDRARATALLDEALGLPIAQPWWHLEAARARLAARDPEGARAQLEVLRALVPRELALELYYAHALGLEGHHRRALAIVDAASAGRAPSPSVLSARGDALAGLGREVEALSAYREALRMRPDFLPAARSLATLVARMRSNVK